jgi:hypothetical protein
MGLNLRLTGFLPPSPGLVLVPGYGLTSFLLLLLDDGAGGVNGLGAPGLTAVFFSAGYEEPAVLEYGFGTFLFMLLILLLASDVVDAALFPAEPSADFPAPKPFPRAFEAGLPAAVAAPRPFPRAFEAGLPAAFAAPPGYFFAPMGVELVGPMRFMFEGGAAAGDEFERFTAEGLDGAGKGFFLGAEDEDPWYFWPEMELP